MPSETTESSPLSPLASLLADLIATDDHLEPYEWGWRSAANHGHVMALLVHEALRLNLLTLIKGRAFITGKARALFADPRKLDHV